MNGEKISKRNFKTPEKRRTMRLPPWFKVKAQTGEDYLKIRHLVKNLDLNTVCEEARCPNIWECWNVGTATFMILGEICTRSCGFCNVGFGQPKALDPKEPGHVAEAVSRLNLKHVVITSVNRDELKNGGAEHFAETIRKIRQMTDCSVEVLIPDFQGKKLALQAVFSEGPDVLAHNIETVPRLHALVRPQAAYTRSLEVLKCAKACGLKTKTGLMLGLGESIEEVEAVMQDLVEIGCDILTLGQYLQPTAKHLPIARFATPEEFLALKTRGEKMGLIHVESGPLVRSSYHAASQVKGLNPGKNQNPLVVLNQGV
ncbi:Lipoyl synthase [hydrothermal vent metagenome]|uniref:lipoyl synthase n=1 Tax=hydrothermal vent metagenome TaxID=652676 RepID=A0A3B1D3T5_9ZZZZ